MDHSAARASSPVTQYMSIGRRKGALKALWLSQVVVAVAVVGGAVGAVEAVIAAVMKSRLAVLQRTGNFISAGR